MREFINLTEAFISEMTTSEKIQALRSKTVANGATPAEAASASAKADELEAKHFGQETVDANRRQRAKDDAREQDNRRQKQDSDNERKRRQEQAAKSKAKAAADRKCKQEENAKSKQAVAARNAIAAFKVELNLGEESIDEDLFNLMTSLMDAFGYASVKRGLQEAILEYSIDHTMDFTQ